MEEYIEKLISQIRCKKARPYIANEIKDHIEEQIDFNKLNGMTEEEAEKSAVMDMGDPVEVGISMDKIHRPKISWRILFIVGILSILGIVIQYSILGKVDSETQINDTYRLSLAGFVSSVIFGFMIMLAIYFIDFTTIAKYSKLIGSFIILSGIMYLAGFFGRTVNGAYYTIDLGMFHFSATALMMFYVPVYGAILYKYRDGGKFDFLKAVIWMIIPVFITFRMPNIVVTGIMLISMNVLLSASLLKGWFKLPVKRTLVCLWSLFLLLPIGILYVMYSFHMMAEYQEARIRAFLLADGDGYYMTSILRAFCDDIPLVGNSGNDVVGSLPNFNSDYIFSYILNSYGSILGIVIISILAVFVMLIFGASAKQKNELGMMMGFGCGMIFLLNTLINILGAVGVLPPAASFLPFFSLGGSNIILCYALVGIVMSIYRYKDVYPVNVADKVIVKKELRI